jgi:DNA polymerase-1
MYLTHKDLERYWVLDCETDSLDPNTIFVCVARNIATDEVKELYNELDWKEFDKDYYIYVTHNGISFDIPKAINPLWGGNVSLTRIVDTLVLSYLYHPNMPDGHSLKAWGERLKCPKTDFDDWTKLTPEMVEYCIQDTAVTAKLFRALTKRMRERGFSEQSCYIEHIFRNIIDEQEASGFAFDKDGAVKLYNELRQKEKELGEKIRSVFKPREVVRGVYNVRTKKDGTLYTTTQRHFDSEKIRFVGPETYEVLGYEEFNIGSPKQRVEYLQSVGWQPTEFTEKGNPKSDEKSIITFATESEIDEVRMIADWLVCNGRANMINTWLENLHEDGKIHGRVMSCGAGSRRCTHSAPNTANIPSVEAKYGRDSRALWITRPHRKLVGIDASGLEGRVFIHYLGSKEAEEFMLADPHTANSVAISNALGFTVDRKPTKNLFYARLYGASDTKLGRMVGGGSNLGRLVRDAIDSNIPGFKELVETVEREWAKNSTFLQTIDGGYVRCPSPHAALNYKFQSCGAIVMKQAAIIHRDWIKEASLDAIKVGDIHDEWQFDCLPAHASLVGEFGCNAIKEAGEVLNMNIALDGEYSVGNNWAETH